MKTLAALDARAKLACLVVFVVVALHARTAISLTACLILAIGLAGAVHLDKRSLRGVMLPIAPILVVTLVMQVLYFQQGDVLAQIGPVAVTAQALQEAARMLVSLLAIMLASVAFMRCTGVEELMSTLRWMLTPLRALGLRTEAFMLSLSVAFRFVPVLIAEFQQIKRAQLARCASFEGGVSERLGAYMRLFAPLVRSSFRRADTLAEALVARCFSCGIEPTSISSGHFGAGEAILLTCTAAIALVVGIAG